MHCLHVNGLMRKLTFCVLLLYVIIDVNHYFVSVCHSVGHRAVAIDQRCMATTATITGSGESKSIAN